MFRKKIFASLTVILLVLSTMLVLRVQASSQTYWEAPLPHEDALLNQTLTTYKHETHGEVGLSANLYMLEKDYPQPGQYEFAIATVAAANSRYKQGYDTSYTTDIIYIFNEVTLNLGDNEGVWVEIGWKFLYYGAWYDKVFITSNGFVVLDKRAYNDNGGKWTSPTPKSIPTTDDPNVLIAPFWRDLDPSQGGTIKYGDGPFDAFVIVWDNVPNKANGNCQTFALYLDMPVIGNAAPYFVYGSITNDVPTSIGFEDQCGKRGVSISSVSSGHKVTFDPWGDNYYWITQIKISASKLTDSGTNDASAVIHIDGLDNTLPGGINVELEEPSEGVYKSFPIVSAATFALSTVALATGYGLVGIVGYCISGAKLAYDLSPIPSSTVHEADQNTMTGYVLALAKDENRPDVRPWDVSISPLIRWRILDPSVEHRLLLTCEVTYLSGSTYTLTTDSLELKLTPGSVSWYGRTNPDAHYYNFYQISTPYGTGYHIDTIGSNDYAYHMLGWSKLTDDAPEDYKVGADGKIRVKGYFRQTDTLPADDQPGRRLVNICVMYSENLNKIVKTAQVLDYTDGTDWRYKGVIISGLTPGKPVKIGIGRPDSWYADWNLVVEWAGIEIYGGAGSPPNTPSQPSGPTSGYTGTSYTYSTSTTDPDGDNIYYLFDWGDDSTTTIGPYASGATVSASNTWGSTGTYDVKVKAKDVYGLWSGYSSSLTVTIYSGGGGCPMLYVWNGAEYVEEGLLDIHNPDGIDVVYEHTLVTTPQRENGAYLLRLTEHHQTHSYIDEVKLYAILEDGTMIQLPLIYAWHSEDGNVLPMLLFSDDWKADTLGADHNNGTSQRINLKFVASLNPNMTIVGFVFQIEGNNEEYKLPY
ncbi:MAG: PKD domain-containing protein [Candidatus Bathyarchaeia archaeon]